MIVIREKKKRNISKPFPKKRLDKFDNLKYINVGFGCIQYKKVRILNFGILIQSIYQTVLSPVTSFSWNDYDKYF